MIFENLSFEIVEDVVGADNAVTVTKFPDLNLIVGWKKEGKV